MTLRTILTGMLACAALVACAPKQSAEEKPADAPAVDAGAPAEEPQTDIPVQPPTEEAVADECGAAGYQALIGTNAAAVTLPLELVHRIYQEGDPVTMDYRPDRLNIVTDADGVIIEVKCG